MNSLLTSLSRCLISENVQLILNSSTSTILCCSACVFFLLIVIPTFVMDTHCCTKISFELICRFSIYLECTGVWDGSCTFSWVQIWTVISLVVLVLRRNRDTHTCRHIQFECCMCLITLWNCYKLRSRVQTSYCNDCYKLFSFADQIVLQRNDEVSLNVIVRNYLWLYFLHTL